MASYLTNIARFLIRYLHCLNPATITFVLSAVSVPTLTFTPPKQLPPPPSYTLSLTTVTLWLWSSEVSKKSSPTHPECSCSNCCPGSKIPTHHSYSEISSLVYSFWTNTRLSLLRTKFSTPLYDLISIQPPHGHNTPSSPYITLIKPTS